MYGIDGDPAAAARSTGIVPVPERASFATGHCDFSRGCRISASRGLENEAALARNWLLAASEAPSGPDPGSGSEIPVELLLGEISHAGTRTESEWTESEWTERGRKPGSYSLELAPGRVRIGASDASGIFYGLVSLRQLLMSHGPRIPAMRIDDAPRFSWRGFMLDTARNFFRVEFIEKMIELAAFHKLNVFHWHLTDDQAWRLELPSRPELAALGARRTDGRFNPPGTNAGSYSPGDVRRIVAFAASRHITVVPEIETPGHAIALLASHPELSCADAMRPPEGEAGPVFSPEDRYGVFEDILCAGNEAVFGLLAEVYDYLASVFPGVWVHAGGDEAPKARWLVCPRCRRRMEELRLRGGDGRPDPEKLQAWFMSRVAGMLAARGKRMVGWDEILEGGTDKDAIVMSWRGYSGGVQGLRAGHEVVMSPQTAACYLDHQHLDLPEEPGRLGVCTVRDSYLFEPLPPGLTETEACGILGAQANIWTELMYFGRQVEYMAFPRLCALSESFWSASENRDFIDFTRRMREFHGKRLDILDVNRFRGDYF